MFFELNNSQPINQGELNQQISLSHQDITFIAEMTKHHQSRSLKFTISSLLTAHCSQKNHRASLALWFFCRFININLKRLSFIALNTVL